LNQLAINDAEHRALAVSDTEPIIGSEERVPHCNLDRIGEVCSLCSSSKHRNLTIRIFERPIIQLCLSSKTPLFTADFRRDIGPDLPMFTLLQWLPGDEWVPIAV